MVNKILLRLPIYPLSYVQNEDFDDKNFLKSIYLSSPQLYEEVLKKDTHSDKKNSRIQKTLSKYWIRYCTRCTPFGTFAGSILINLDANAFNKIILNEPEWHKEHARLDMGCIFNIVQHLLSIDEVKQRVKYFPNNTLYDSGNEYRYLECEGQRDGRKYVLTSIDKTEFLSKAICRAEQGITLEKLVQFIAEVANVEKVEADDFVNDLERSQVLISELEPALSGGNHIEKLISKLEQINFSGEALISKLSIINEILQKPRKDISSYKEVEKYLHAIVSLGNERKNLFHVDTFLSVKDAGLDNTIIENILQQANDLTSLSRPMQNDDLSNFIHLFKRKYGEEEISLVKVLDVESGIGYAGNWNDKVGKQELIDDLYIEKTSDDSSTKKDYVREYVVSKYDEFLSGKGSTIELKEEELTKYSEFKKKMKFSKGQFIFGTLMGASENNFCFEMKNYGISSSVSLLGRFAYSNSEIKQYVLDLLAEEESVNPDCIHAEIIHLPEENSGNVLLRPILSKYEIPYAGNSGIDMHRQINVEDLMVSIVNGVVVLRSKKYNKRVLPRLTTAHNFRRRQSLPVYKFLCDMQFQGLTIPGVWDWGDLEMLKVLPRVVYKNLVLKCARWKVAIEDFKDYPNETELQRKFIAKFRIEKSIPQRVIYSEGDNELLIDLETDTGKDIFIEYLKKNKNILIKECLYSENNSIVLDEKGNPYVNEILIPIVSEEITTYGSAKISPIGQKLNVKKSFPPYSEWCYFKVYCGNKIAERILSSNILGFVEDGIKKSMFEKFFFIRFNDDFPHFRIRFYNSDVSKQEGIISEFSSLMNKSMEEGVIDKIMLDTYKREISRYSSLLIETVESLFFFDSLSVLRLISILREAEDPEKYRFLFALRGVDMLLDDFGYSLRNKSELLQELSDSYFTEFGGSPILLRQLQQKYRKYQKEIFSHQNPEFDDYNGITEGIGILMDRSYNIKKLIQESFSSKQFLENKNWYLPSYIHMFLNRLFASGQRKYELIVYFFLNKYYKSQLAILKN